MKKMYRLVHSKDIDDQRILESNCNRGMPEHTQQSQRLPSLDHYLNAKIKDIKWLLTDTADQKIL